MKVLLIDNYDSFVYNLARYVNVLGGETHVVRNDAISVNDIQSISPTHIIISPGPKTPSEAGISLNVIRTWGDRIPILGVCLGHQAIGEAYGGKVIQAKRPMHGKASTISHAGVQLFHGLHSSLKVGRYHSLIVSDDQLPSELQVTARSEEGEIMALSHIYHPVFGVQFHPESVLTEEGFVMLGNFLRY